jgi:undecaprenyl diphosphate synthase
MADDDTSQRESLDLTIDEGPVEAYDGTIPDHVAIIMDGNGRWASRRDMPRIRGHRAGASSVRAVVEACRYLQMEVLTLYAFSTENWSRPDDEVTGLMTLFDVYIERERERLLENDIRLQVIGDRSGLPDTLLEAIEELEAASAGGDEMTLQVAVNYGGREEIVRAARAIGEDVEAGELEPDAIDESTVESRLYTAGRPDPDLVVRTSGEMRFSNFLLWQIAYSELFVNETLWPDFDEYELVEALRAFDARERRFGKTGEQVDD